MSAITKEFTKEQLQQIIETDHVQCGEASSLARIALASLEAEASGRNPVLAYADSYRDMANQGVESIPVWSVITDLERNIAPLFTATPAPVSVPDAMEMDDDFDSAFEHGKAVGWNAYRAAMLQGSDGTLTNEDTKRVGELVMWVKRLAHSLRKANPDSKLQSDAMDYLSRKGLIGVEDILR
ncbi:hypothetical protein [Enterobacter rongchengensis]|uniref:hypothetical protein n=1 Tax=Enterobacter rongchengensis TaxID=3030999 RepID=UPI002A530D69|nr:hypothetical protein [Enterobacter sp. 170250]